MRNRVSPKWPARKRYFDRGITVCDEWEVFSVFKEWAVNNGFAENLDLDRIDNDKGYSPDNCRWISHKENTKNRQNTIYVNDNGTEVDITTYCEKHGIPNKVLKYARERVCKLGWNPYDAIHTPTKTYNKSK